jgi:hypothetical protein
VLLFTFALFVGCDCAVANEKYPFGETPSEWQKAIKDFETHSEGECAGTLLMDQIGWAQLYRDEAQKRTVTLVVTHPMWGLRFVVWRSDGRAWVAYSPERSEIEEKARRRWKRVVELRAAKIEGQPICGFIRVMLQLEFEGDARARHGAKSP